MEGGAEDDRKFGLDARDYREQTIGKKKKRSQRDGGRRQFHKHSRNTRQFKVTETALLLSRRPLSGRRAVDDGEPSSKRTDGRLNNRKPCARERHMLRKDEAGKTRGDVVQEKTKEKQRGRVKKKTSGVGVAEF